MPKTKRDHNYSNKRYPDKLQSHWFPFLNKCVKETWYRKKSGINVCCMCITTQTLTNADRCTNEVIFLEGNLTSVRICIGFNADLDPYPGFCWQKKLQFTYPQTSLKDVQSTEDFSPQKEHSALQTWNFFFYLCG